METLIITPNTYSTHADAMERYHRLRHDIFVSLSGLGRNDLYAAAGQETDIWDLPHFNPVHFLVQDEGEAIAVGRMTSAVRPTMMEILYSDFLDGDVPKGPELWEVQRVGVDLINLSPAKREEAFLTLFTEMEGYALRNGVRQLMLLTFEGIWRKRLQEMRRVGPVKEHLGFPHVALINYLDPEAHAQRCANLDAIRRHNQEEEAA